MAAVCRSAVADDRSLHARRQIHEPALLYLNLRLRWLLLVDVLRVEHSLANDLSFATCRIDPAEQATSIAFVAGRSSNLVDSYEDRVGITVQINRPDFLDIAALFALTPELLATATEVNDTARTERFRATPPHSYTRASARRQIHRPELWQGSVLTLRSRDSPRLSPDLESCGSSVVRSRQKNGRTPSV